MESEIKEINENLLKLMRDMELIKGLLMSKVDDEGELSDWAKKEIEEARMTPSSQSISHEEVKKRILKR
jgi:hypothetical protein